MSKETIKKLLNGCLSVDSTGQIDFNGTPFENNQDARIIIQELYDKVENSKSSCSHFWGEIEKTIEEGSLSDYINFYYQRCQKCGLIKRI